MEHSVPAKARVGVIIVNYGAAAIILEHLAGLATECAQLPGSQIVIVDNQSPNGDGDLLEARLANARYAAPVRLVRAPRNGGFSYGNNRGVEAIEAQGGADYYYLLNPDAWVLPGAIVALADFMARHPKAGFVGSRLEHPDGAPQNSAFRFHSVASELDFAAKTGPISKLVKRWQVAPPSRNEAHQTDWVCGASVLIRKEAFMAAGGFDEGYFLYYEETDLMRAGARAGWQTWYEPKARVVHMMGGATGVKDGRTADRATPVFMFQSRRRYFRKNHGAVYAALADIAWVAGSLVDYARGLAAGRDMKPLRTDFSRFFSVLRAR
jgi:GT2 family glycosyltransferase